MLEADAIEPGVAVRWEKDAASNCFAATSAV